MPLKLKPPREGKTPYWSVRGTHLGVFVDRSTKLTDRRKAEKLRQKWKAEIERGEFAQRGSPTFLSASVGYLKAGGDGRFLGPIIDHFGETPLARIDQEAIDDAAAKLYPNVAPATRNRQLYTPVAAVLHHAGIERQIKRPKGSAGAKRTRWLWPNDAFRIFDAAATVDTEFSILLIFLCYCGPRLSEALYELLCDTLRIDESFAYLGKTKSGEPRAVYLPPIVVKALKRHPRGLDRPGERVFRFNKNGWLYRLLRVTKEKAGADLAWVGFHTFCHTYGTWMRRYGGLDAKGLVGTGRWADIKSVDRYTHVIASEESRQAAVLPVPKPKTGARQIRGKTVEPPSVRVPLNRGKTRESKKTQTLTDPSRAAATVKA